MSKIKPKAKTIIFLALISLASGCGHLFPSHTVLIDPSQNLMRAGPDMLGRVYYFNKDGKMELSKEKVKIPEGSYIGPRTIQ